MKEKILILGNYRQTIAVVRSLGRAGYHVVVGRDAEKAYSESSRYARGHLPFTFTPLESYYGAIEGYLGREKPGAALVFPIGEFSLERLAKAPRRFEGATIAMPQPEVVLQCLDKTAMNALAGRLNVLLPPSAAGFDRAAWTAKAAEFGFPCIIKRNSSFNLVNGLKALTIHTPAELEAFLDAAASDPHPETLLLQKRIEGFRHNCQFAAVDGKLVAYFQQKVLRTDVLDGSGYCVEGVSVAPDPLMRLYTERLVKSLNYTGVGCTQFLMGEDDRRAYFLELNPRLDANCALAISCGVDFPLLAVECGRIRAGLLAPTALPAVSSSYVVGRRMAWLQGDLFGWLHAVHHRQVGAKDAVLWLGQIALSALRNRLHTTWEASDPLPAFSFWTGQLRAVLRSLRKIVLRRAEEKVTS